MLKKSFSKVASVGTKLQLLQQVPTPATLEALPVRCRNVAALCYCSATATATTTQVQQLYVLDDNDVATPFALGIGNRDHDSIAYHSVGFERCVCCTVVTFELHFAPAPVLSACCRVLLLKKSGKIVDVAPDGVHVQSGSFSTYHELGDRVHDHFPRWKQTHHLESPKKAIKTALHKAESFIHRDRTNPDSPSVLTIPLPCLVLSVAAAGTCLTLRVQYQGGKVLRAASGERRAKNLHQHLSRPSLTALCPILVPQFLV